MRQFAVIVAIILTAACARGQVGPYSYEEGFDRPGSDYETFEQTSDYQSHELCRDACFSQPRCKAYTYVKPGVAGPKALCRLKDKVPPPVENACCISAVKGGKPKVPAVSSLQLQWLGWDADKVGNARAPQKPDGAPDHSFVLRTRAASSDQVLRISLIEAADGGLRWSNSGSNAEYLGVESAVGRDGEVVFKLYAHDLGRWAAGSSLIAEVKLPGRTVAHEFELQPPADRLLGRWQMHCTNTPPHMFEAMNQSGRMQFVRQGDDTLTGWFGTMRLRGKMDSSGNVRGTAEGGGGKVSWSGKLESPRRGKPLRGAGTFTVEAHRDGCTGTGSWNVR